MTDLSAFAELVPADHGLCVSTLRGDGSIQSSVVNAGVLEHPAGGGPVVGLVARGGSRKLANLRADPRATIVVRAGWRWAAVDGDAQLIGPDDPHPGVSGRRAAAAAAGGVHGRGRHTRGLRRVRPGHGGRAPGCRAHHPPARLLQPQA